MKTIRPINFVQSTITNSFPISKFCFGYNKKTYSYFKYSLCNNSERLKWMDICYDTKLCRPNLVKIGLVKSLLMLKVLLYRKGIWKWYCIEMPHFWIENKIMNIQSEKCIAYWFYGIRSLINKLCTLIKTLAVTAVSLIIRHKTLVFRLCDFELNSLLDWTYLRCVNMRNDHCGLFYFSILDMQPRKKMLKQMILLEYNCFFLLFRFIEYLTYKIKII